jgi:hypothetical protein
MLIIEIGAVAFNTRKCGSLQALLVSQSHDAFRLQSILRHVALVLSDSFEITLRRCTRNPCIREDDSKISEGCQST